MKGIRCTECGLEIEHKCHSDVEAALSALLGFDVEFKAHAKKLMQVANDGNYYEDGDENAPFFTESFLYPLFGKEDARTLIALVHNVAVACGFDPEELMAQRDKVENIGMMRSVLRNLYFCAAEERKKIFDQYCMKCGKSKKSNSDFDQCKCEEKR